MWLSPKSVHMNCIEKGISMYITRSMLCKITYYLVINSCMRYKDKKAIADRINYIWEIGSTIICIACLPRLYI